MTDKTRKTAMICDREICKQEMNNLINSMKDGTDDKSWQIRELHNKILHLDEQIRRESSEDEVESILFQLRKVIGL